MKYIILFCMTLCFATVAVPAQTDIHGVDFKNFTYSASCAGEKPEKVTIKDGEFLRETKMEDYTDRFSFGVMAITYGDLNGDGKDEAVVLSICNTGGTGQFTEGFVFTMKAGKPTLWQRIPGGDRADGGLVKATVEGGLLLIEANESSTNSGACCPEFTVTEKYRLTANKMVAVGKGVRRELYPRERLSFDKGTSGKTFTVKIGSYDRKRYVLSAGAGQTMTVSTDVDGADARLLDDAEVTDGKNSFTAKLPKKGDYTIEVANNTDSEQTITVTVKIM